MCLGWQATDCGAPASYAHRALTGAPAAEKDTPLHARHWGRRARRSGAPLVLVAALALALPATTAGSAAADDPGRTPAAVSPLRLWAPDRIEAFAYGKRVYSDLGLRVIAQGAPFELWSTRSSYDEQIATTWRRGAAGDVPLPAGSMQDFSGLRSFLTLTITPKAGGPALTVRRKGCLDAWSERIDPAAPATSPYPRACWYNPYSLGSVQGLQEGWAAPVLAQRGPLRLAAGTYTVTASIAPRYVSAFGLAPADATRTLTLVVRNDTESAVGRARPGRVARPAAHRPAGPAARRAAGPVPDLRSLPAWGIRVSENGNYLQFSATVWNAGDSPLVVDGFRRDGEDEMDAYQYFFDGAGHQTGYQQVGQMHWDPRPSHQHWHFEDFARYVLLRADRTEAVRSRKEAFCLANTDAVDQTVPGAVWNPENTDLATSCGDYGSLSIREVLASGWGDTYAQFRAGQSFDLEGLPNGTYYIAVMANPDGRLVESATDNNVSLRQVVIGGRQDHRTVRVPQVGVIVEPTGGGKG